MDDQAINNILLIDDNEVDNAISKEIIMSTGQVRRVFTVTTADSGLDLINNLLVDIEASKFLMPQIIFLDINMPIRSGFGFMDLYMLLDEGIREKIMIYVLSSSADIKDKRKSKEFRDIRGYIQKPLNADQVKSIIKKYLDEVKPGD